MKRDWLVWLKAAGIRAVRTFAEAALAYIGTGAMVLGDVNWLGVLSAGAFGAITALRYCQDFCANSLILMRTCKDHDNHLLS